MKRIICSTLFGIATWCSQTDANAADPNYAKPYGPYDAIREGSENNHARQRDLIDQQLDTVDRLNTYVVPNYVRPVTFPRIRARLGQFGVPQPAVVVAPDGSTSADYRVESRVTARQPVGRQEVQTGPNRWESRPLYAGDIARQPAGRVSNLTPPSVPSPSDAPRPYAGRQIDLQTRGDYQRAVNASVSRDASPRGNSRGGSQPAAVEPPTNRLNAEPEELPVPTTARNVADQNGRPARDIAREDDVQPRASNVARTRSDSSPAISNAIVPPPARPDVRVAGDSATSRTSEKSRQTSTNDQPPSVMKANPVTPRDTLMPPADPKPNIDPSSDDAGPVLQDPSTVREF